MKAKGLSTGRSNSRSKDRWGWQVKLGCLWRGSICVGVRLGCPSCPRGGSANYTFTRYGYEGSFPCLLPQSLLTANTPQSGPLMMTAERLQIRHRHSLTQLQDENPEWDWLWTFCTLSLHQTSDMQDGISGDCGAAVSKESLSLWGVGRSMCRVSRWSNKQVSVLKRTFHKEGWEMWG